MAAVAAATHCCTSSGRHFPIDTFLAAPCHSSRRQGRATRPDYLSPARPSYSSLCPARPSVRLLRNQRPNCVPSAVVSEKPAVVSSPVRLTYLEGNSWLWDFGGLNILVDPILVGNLDFGIPWLYDAAKKVIKHYHIEDLPDLDCLLITQSLDDHCHVKTLMPLSKMRPGLQVISTPNAEPILQSMFSNVIYLEPGQSFNLEGKNGSKVTIRATAGPVLGPPWQRPENGYLVFFGQSDTSLYYEPHCVPNYSLLEKDQADVIITPVIKQLLPSFTLVSGQEDAVKVAKLLKAKFVVPMKNGDLDSKGILSSIISSEGTVESFKQLLLKELPNVRVLEPIPGVPLEIPLTSEFRRCIARFTIKLLGWGWASNLQTMENRPNISPVSEVDGMSTF